MSEFPYLVDKILVSNRRLTIVAEAFFSKKYINENFFVEYSGEESFDLPEEILLAPFLFNIAPVVWLSGNMYRLRVCDLDQYQTLLEVRNVMRELYPKLSWDGGFEVDRLVDSKYVPAEPEKGGVAVLFSGGLDSIATSMRHQDKKQLLLAVHGADVALDNNEGWRQVQLGNELYARNFGYETGYIKSNVIGFLNTKILNHPREGVFNWWGCVQHGMGLCGLALPVIVNRGISTLLIGSSFTETFSKPWGSSPDIDNKLKLGGHVCVHDAYEWTRQAKLAFVVNCQRDESEKAELRVCHARPAFGEGNCGRCEKCLRTMCGLAVEGEQLKDWGFDVDTRVMAKRIRAAVNNVSLKFGDVSCFFWQDIQGKAKSSPESLVAFDNDFYQWLVNFDFNQYLIKYQEKPISKPSFLYVYVLPPLKSFLKKNKIIKNIIIAIYRRVF